MLRPDELYAKEILERYFQSIAMDIKIINGNNPPDLIAIYNNKRIPLEVTRAEHKCIGKIGLENRRSIDSSNINICNAVNKELGQKIPPYRTLLVVIYKPASDGSKFRNSFKKMVRSIVNDKTQLDSLYRFSMKTTIEDVPIELKLIDSLPEYGRIFGIVDNRNAIFDIVQEVTLVLSDRIQDKERKIIAIDGEKWLAIINNLVSASSDNFIEAFSEINTVHTFTKIFLIGNGKVIELYNAS